MTDSGNTPVRTESDVYDRQIRLWGAEAQSKMSSARVLYVHITGVSSEILKNLVLAGVRAAICDGRPYPSTASTTPSSFLPPAERLALNDEKEGYLPPQSTEESDGERPTKKRRSTTMANAMKPYVEELNPLLDECEINETPIEDVPDSYFEKFDIVIASRLGIRQAVRIASATTSSGGKFYLVDTFGLSGCAAIDLGEKHEFRRELGKKLSDVTRLSSYLSMKHMMGLKLANATGRFDKVPPRIWAMYRSLLEYQDETGSFPSSETAADFAEKTMKWLDDCGDAVVGKDFLGSEAELKQLSLLASAEVSPVCAVLGGLLGNEVIKAISGKGEPANNLLLFDGTDGSCRNFLLKFVSQ